MTLDQLRIRCDALSAKSDVLADSLTEVEVSLQELRQELLRRQSLSESKTAAFLAGISFALLLSSALRQSR